MKKLLLLVVMLFSIGLQSTMAQSRTVTGKVLNDQGEGIPGASIKVKGTQAGTISDIDGNFKVDLPADKNVIVINALGFAQKEIKVENTSEPLIARMEVGQNQTLGTIQIYGQTIDPRKNTGAVTTITADDIDKRSITNIAQALSGAPGVNVTSGGGQPGSDPDIHVRGFGSLSASSAPLIVVDGAIYDGPLSSINPANVETESLLKDATAGALYGARGSNGVILITTKKGKNTGKPQIRVNLQSGIVNRMLPPMQTIDEADYYKMAFLMYKNWAHENGQSISADANGMFWTSIMGGYNAYDFPTSQLIDTATGMVNPNAKLLYDDDWMGALSRNGLRQQYNVSVSNATDKSDYFFSVGYNNDEGIVKYTGFERFTTQLKVNAHVTDWLTSGLNLTGTYTNQTNFVQDQNAYSNPFFTAQMMGPIFPIYLYDSLGNKQYEADGTTPIYDFGDNPDRGQSRHFGKNTNVIASLQQDQRINQAYRGRAIGYLEAKFLKDFTLRSDISLDYVTANDHFYGNMLYGDFATIKGVVQKTLQTQVSYTFRQMLVWHPSFAFFGNGDHSLAITLDHENYLLSLNSYFLERSGFPSPEFHEGAAAAVSGASTSSFSQHAIESYVALANYDYKKKYFLTLSARRDGTSRFSPTARWGNFWSAGLGWNMAEENFIKDNISWISTLHPRVSYGITGNENVGGFYPWLPRYYFDPNASHPGYNFNSWGNPDLKWEGKFEFNVGADIGIYNDRILASIEYYNNGSKDLLYVRPYAPSTGIGGIVDNVGGLKNTGIELILNADVIRTHNFTWSAQLNLQHVKNSITEMQGTQDSIIGTYTLTTKGLPYNTYFLPEYAGVDHETGAELWRLADGTDTSDYNVASLTKNRKNFGSSFRDLEGSFSSTFNYKGFELSFLITFGIGGKFYDNNYALLMQPDNALQGYGWSPDILDSWTVNNKDADIPKVTIGDANIGHPSDRFLLDASFLKLQSAKLSYTLPSKWLKSAQFRTLSVFVSGDNLYLLAARKGVDIQQSYFGSSSLNYYPYRSIMFGINLGL